ncbi:MAG: pilus assembly protein PilM [Candidatus Paceibacterota bacterium]
MPLSSSFLTVVPVTVADGQDISTRIPIEAKKYVPLPLSDVTLDWTELEPMQDDATQVREVLLAAIENRALSEYRGLLDQIGMTGEPAEIEAFSLVRALWKQSDSTLAIIDIGAKTAKLYIVRNGTLERIHRVAAGGERIARVAELLGVNFGDAEELKRNYQKDSPHAKDIYKAMSSVIAGPLQEFARLMSRYEARLGSPIGRVVCTGGVTHSPYFVPYTKDLLAREIIDVANPFSRVAYPAFMEDTLSGLGPTFAVALGAALQQFQDEG